MSDMTPRVTVKRELAHLIPFFVSNRRSRVDEALAHCADGDLQTLRHMGHDFKGTCGSYGFQQLSELGAALEKAPDLESACALVQRMKIHLEQVQVDYA